MSIELMTPMSEELVWANVMRPRTPLVYLDLNTIIYIAKTLRGDKSVPAGYGQLYEAALRAKAERRAAFPLGESHLWEITKITDPKQRHRLAEVLESLSDFNYLLGRVSIAELEFDAGIAKVMREEPRLGSLSLLRPTFGQVFGMVGGMNILDADGRDGSEAVRAEMDNHDYFALRARLNVEVERFMLRAPRMKRWSSFARIPSTVPRSPSRATRVESSGKSTPSGF